MFSSVGWGELLVLLVAGLVILGPERLPGAVTWTMKSLRQVREYASGATSQLKDDLGPEFEDFRKPLAELNELRGMTPRSLITKHLLDGDDSFFSGKFDDDTRIKPVSAPMPEINPTPAPSLTTDTGSTPSLTKDTGATPSSGEDTGSAPSMTKKTEPTTRSTPGSSTGTGDTGRRSVVDWDAT